MRKGVYMITLNDFLGLMPESQRFSVRICSFKNPDYHGMNYSIIKEFNFDKGYPDKIPSDMVKYLEWYIDYVYSEINGYVHDESYIFLLIFDENHGRDM